MGKKSRFERSECPQSLSLLSVQDSDRPRPARIQRHRPTPWQCFGLFRWDCQTVLCQTCNTNPVIFPRSDSRNSLCWKKNFPRDKCGAGGDWQKFNRLPDKIMYGQKYGLTLVKPSESTETRMEKRGAKTRPCSKTDRNSLYWSWWSRLPRNSLCKKMRGENWKDPWHQLCLPTGWFTQASRKWLQSRKLPSKDSQKRFMVVRWNLMNPQDNEWGSSVPA